MGAGVQPSAVVLVIIDGLSDVSITSLMAAETPTLDRAASRGRVGLIDPVEPGLACGSDTAHLSIFGYEPRTCYHGRGALEALGAGLSLTPDSVAFKASFASLTSDQHVCPLVGARCASNHPQMHSLASRLSSSLNNIQLSKYPEVEVAVHHTGGHRCNVSISGPNLSDRITNTDPLSDDLPLQLSCAIDPRDADAVRTAAIVNCMSDRIHHILCKHPENTIQGVGSNPITDVLLLRGASQHIIVEPFLKRHGINAFLIAPTHIIAGVGITVGISLLPVDGATGGYDTDLLKKASACTDELMRTDVKASHQSYLYSLGVLHVKAVDEASHEQDSHRRNFWMEKADHMIAHLLRQLRRYGRRDVVLAVTGDHSSPVSYGDHTCDPVPILFTDVFDPDSIRDESPKYIFPDECTHFTETSAGSYGSLGRFHAAEVMPTIKAILHGKSNTDNC